MGVSSGILIGSDDEQLSFKREMVMHTSSQRCFCMAEYGVYCLPAGKYARFGGF
jgi:hypothetical protein